MTLSTWPRHSGTAVFAPTYTKCVSTHVLHGKISTYSLAAKPHTNGDLASNAKENMSVFSMHFHNVLNNHRPVDDTVLELIPQKQCLTNIDTPITFSKVKRAIAKIKKGKAPGPNGIPP
jgi:NADPH:quinone reductase-like Zn-dependent oxidoreductase